MRFKHSNGLRPRSEIAVALLILIALGGTSVASSASALKKKHLSLANVTIATSASVGYQVAIAAGQGFFKQQGVNVTNESATGTGAPAIVALLVAGQAQFIALPPTSVLPAVQAGTPINCVMALENGSDSQLIITTAAAAAHNIPTSANTPAQSLKQFEALKGSHLNIGIGSITAAAYYVVAGLADLHGLTAGIGAPGDDLNLIVEGSSANEDAAFLAGKVDGITAAPPQTVEPGAITIKTGGISPLNTQVGECLSTPASMVKQHADTVQAVVTALIEAVHYAKLHPSGAEKDSGAFLATTGITSPEEAQYLYVDLATDWITPISSRAAFNGLESFQNLVSTPPLTVTFSNYIDNSFANKAIKELGLKFPNVG